MTASEAPVRVLLIDNNSGPAARKAAAQLADGDPRVHVRRSDRNLGCAGGRRLGAELVETEYTLFLDDDAELHDGALEALVADLDTHPEAGAVTALVLEPDCSVFHFGGWIEASEAVAEFTLDARRRSADDSSLPGSGPIGWVPGTAALVRTELLRSYPIDPGMDAYYEDNEWCYRIALEHPDAFRRCREAVATHHVEARTYETPFSQRSAMVERLGAYAHFLERHGRLMEVDLGHVMPELRGPDGTLDWEAARLLLELVRAKGTDWVFAEWYAGGLAPLLGRGAQQQRMREVESERDAAELRASEAEAWGSAMQRVAVDVEFLNDTLRRIQEGGWWKLRGRLLPLIRLAGALRRKIKR